MNIKLLIAITVLLATGSIKPVFSASDRDISTFFKTRKCIDCNLSNLNSIYSNYQLHKQDLRNTNLQGANLYHSNLSISDLRNANLSNTNAKFVNFKGADLRSSNFSYADVSGADFCHADVRDVNWTGVIFTKSTKCLPDEAIDYVGTESKVNNNHSVNYCRDQVSNSSSSKKSSSNDLDTVKETTNTIREIIKLF